MNGDAVIIVDPQQRFTKPGAPFEVPDAGAIIAGMDRFNRAARSRDTPVFWLTRSIRPQVGPGKRTKGTYDLSNFVGEWAEIDGRLAVDERDIHIEKPRHSGFFATDLESCLRQLDVDHLYLCGFTINVCCLATAVDAVARDFGVTLLSDLSGAREAGRGADAISAEEVHRTTCNLFRYGLGAVATSDDVLDEWSRP